MGRVKRGALLTRLMDRLEKCGSRCGETHLQKAVYFAQEVVGIPTKYEFVLYKHDPFSFYLRDELTALRADEVVALEPRWHYGPGIVTTERAVGIQKLYPKTLRKYGERIDFVAKAIGARNVMELEKLPTALYVRRKDAGTNLSVEKTAGRITELKPHISSKEAISAVREVDTLIKEAEAAGVAAA